MDVSSVLRANPLRSPGKKGDHSKKKNIGAELGMGERSMITIKLYSVYIYNIYIYI